MPHSHSIFLLPDHDHRLHDHSRQERADEPAADLEAASPHPGLPRVAESTSRASKLQMIAQEAALLTGQQGRRITTSHTNWRMPGDRTERPNPPPPRHAS